MVEAIPSVGPMNVTGAGEYSTVSHSGSMDMTMQGDGQNLQMQEIMDGSTVYVKMPSSIASEIPGGKQWFEMDLGAIGKSSYLSSLGSLMSSPSYQDPAQFLNYLEAESSDVKNLGQSTVNGVQTTHYAATVNLQKAGSGLPSSVRAVVQGLLKKLPGTILNETAIPVDVWIDSDHLVRQMTMTMKLTPKGQSGTIDTSIKMDMTGYGAQATPALPPASETLNLLALLKSEGKGGLLGG